jgi:hypothetical protein
MARFFFHLDGPNRIQDDEGEEFPTVDAAINHARSIAWELARNSNPSANIGICVALADEQQRELLTIPLIGATQPR